MRRWIQKLWHQAFVVGIALKGLDGLVEVAAGGGLMFTTPEMVRRLVAFFTRAELIEDPHALFANLFVRLSQDLSLNTQQFAGIYLLMHGIVKTGLAIGLLREVDWAYPAALAFLGAFVIYQVIRIAHSPSITLALLTVFDVAIIALIWREWRKREGVRG